MNNKKFTLIELIVVITILGILASLIVPNISSFKGDATVTAIASNVRNFQTSVDMYSLKNNGQYPTANQPTEFIPEPIDFTKLDKTYMKTLPKTNGVKYWVDFQGRVWASTVDAPQKVTNTGGTITWETVEGAVKYQVFELQGYKGVIGTLAQSKANLILLGETTNTTYTGETDKYYVINALDEHNFQTAPAGKDYQGYVKSIQQEGENQTPVTPTDTIKPNGSILEIKEQYTSLKKGSYGSTINTSILLNDGKLFIADINPNLKTTDENLNILKSVRGTDQAMYGSTQLSNGNIVVSEQNDRWTIYDTNLNRIKTGTIGGTGVLYTVSSSLNGNFILGGSEHTYYVYDKNGNVIKGNTWAGGSTKQIKTSLNTKSDNFLIAGDTGSYQIISNSGVSIKSGTWIDTNVIYSSANLDNGNILLAGGSGKWAIYNESMQLQKSGQWTWGNSNIYAVKQLKNGDIFLIGGYGVWQIIDINGNYVNKGVWSYNSSSMDVFTTTQLSNGNIFLGGKNGYYELLSYATTPTEWISGSSRKGIAKLKIEATDNESGVKRIQTPEGTWINGSVLTYSVTRTGAYQFIIEDNEGNQTTLQTNVTITTP